MLVYHCVKYIYLYMIFLSTALSDVSFHIMFGMNALEWVYHNDMPRAFLTWQYSCIVKPFTHPWCRWQWEGCQGPGPNSMPSGSGTLCAPPAWTHTHMCEHTHIHTDTVLFLGFHRGGPKAHSNEKMGPLFPSPPPQKKKAAIQSYGMNNFDEQKTCRCMH